MATISTDILQAAKLLKSGKLVAIPTETVYGLAGNALDEQAVLAIFHAKNRPHFNPLILHCGNFTQLESFVSVLSPNAQKLIKAYMPGPITLLLPKKSNVSDLITSGSDKVAVRIPNHPLTLALLQSLDFPLAAPSANPFGYISPTSASHVETQLGDKIDFILDGGECKIGVESTIVGFDEADNPLIYRLGGLSIEDIEKIVGKSNILSHNTAVVKPQTAGQLLSHYAPKTPLLIGDIASLVTEHGAEKIGALVFEKKCPLISLENQFVLSETGDIDEAAKNLFKAMRHLDSIGLRLIFAEKLPEKGLGRAINDRLNRAKVENKLLYQSKKTPLI